MADYDSDATVKVKSDNTEKARKAVASLAAAELVAKNDAVAQENYAQLAPKYSAQSRAYWKAASAAWKLARIKADTIVTWYQTAASNPGSYYPLIWQWDPMRVSTGKDADVRRDEYAARQAQTDGLSKPPKLSFPAAPQPSPPPVQASPTGPLPPIAKPPGTNPPLNEPPGPIVPQPTDPAGPVVPQPTDPGGPIGVDPGSPDPGGPTPPGQGSPVVAWLVPLGLVGGVLWHLFGRGRK